MPERVSDALSGVHYAGMDLRMALSKVCAPEENVASTRVKMPIGSPALGGHRQSGQQPAAQVVFDRAGRDEPDVVIIHGQLTRERRGEGFDTAGGDFTP